jgi:hypothetical protein
VFGTFFLPKHREPDDRVGISDMPDFPQRLDGVFLSPFTWKHHRLPGPRPKGHA